MRRCSRLPEGRTPRSTKAGVRTPATPPVSLLVVANVERSTKAGVRTPATHAGADRPRGDFGRSTKAGVRTPATRGAYGDGPGDPHERSTKAGVRTPATRGVCLQTGNGLRRSTKAGVRTPATPASWRGVWSWDSYDAQRRLGFEPQRHSATSARSFCGGALNEGWGSNPSDTSIVERAIADCPGRSTKAGVRTPATLVGRSPVRAPPTSLNEGWGSNPSDTANRIRGGTLREDCPVLRLREP